MKAISSLILSWLFFFACARVHGQAEASHPDLSTISIAVAMPKEMKGLTEEQMSILENRIKNIVSMNGLSAEGGLEGFVIYPKFDVLGKDEAPGALKTVILQRCNLSLYVRQFISNSSSNIVFSSYNKDITGSGYSEDEAIANAITQIRPGEDDFQSFLDKTRSRIVSYYVQNCDRIVNEAQNAANLENYEKSFALLLSIPKEAAQCYGQVQQKLVEIYLKKQRQECSRSILQAKSYSAAGDFQNALETLRKVDPESVCKEDLFSLLNEIEAKVDAKEKEALELYKEQMRNAVELEKARYAAIAEMGKAYLDAQGRRNYIVTGNGPNATIVQDPSMPVSYPSGASSNPGPRQPIFPNISLPDNQAADILATTTLQPSILFENNIFPSFIVSRASYNTSVDNMKKYGDINSCIGLSVSNNTNSGTLTYEIEPVENKYFDKVKGTISFTRNEAHEYFPPIPWKYDALRGIQQSTPLSIKFRLIDKGGQVKEQVVKVNFRSIRECITGFTLDGKSERTTLLAAYVNEENPQIDRLLKEGIDKNWVTSWAAYQLGPQDLDRQVKAIWKILSSKGIRYSDITGSTTNTSQMCFSQTVRPFCESIYNKQANCVDGTLVFASIMKKIGIRPALVLVPGHCFLAFHRTDTDDNDYIFLETTMLGNIKGTPTEQAFEANYFDALKSASATFAKTAKEQVFIIDVEKARLQKVSPINLSDESC